MVIYIDRYFNAITNISLKLFNEVVNNKKFRISFTSYFIDKISKTYNEVTEGEILALFSSEGYLQIAQNKGDAANQLGLALGSLVLVEFENDENL